MNLRPYQSRAVRAVREARLAGHRRIVLVSPTGSGKTVLLSTMTLQAVAQGQRLHRRPLSSLRSFHSS